MPHDHHALDVLRYWTLVEEFTPPVVDKKNKTGTTNSIQNEVFGDKDIPWLEKERFETHTSTSNYKWGYTVFFGMNKIKTVLNAIKEVFSDVKDRYNESDNKDTCMLAFKVDVHGKPLAETLEVPDYLVTMSCVTQCDPPSLSYIDFEKKEFIREQIEDTYRNFCDEFEQKKRIRPVDFELLNQLLNRILELTNWQKLAKPGRPFIQNTISVRGQKIPLSEKHSEKPFFNSYFIYDITKVQRKWKQDPSNISKALQQYLVLEPSKQREDLTDRDTLRKYVSPQLLAPARWPCAGDYPLAINQQAAVNLALQKSSGLFSVNGPPGTGKTTLLNDIISNVIVARAKAIAALGDPTDAFERPIEEVIDKKTYSVWTPKSVLKGYEIVIASSNNNAVENISREIPSQDAVDPRWELEYFSALTEPVLDLPNCWGMCAVALGKRHNIDSFFNKFWKNTTNTDSPSFNDWLDACIRSRQNRRKTFWLKAKKEFNNALKAYNTACQQLINTEQDLEKLYTVTKELQQAQQQQEDLQQQVIEQEESLASLERSKCLLDEKYNDCQKQLQHWKDNGPGWWSQCTKDELYRQWSTGYSKALQAWDAAQHKLTQRKEEVQTMQKQLKKLERSQKQLEYRIQSLQAEVSNEEKNVQRHKVRMGRHLPDSDFWQQPEDDLQQCTPWYSVEMHKLRGDLFVKAIRLHRAFIGYTAVQFYDNLSSMHALLAQKKKWTGKDNVFPALWTSLCTIVPVISTTFASVGNLKGLGKEDIGWLLIDEAGQASPQAAVGALQRAKRAIVVGDPLQIEPVVTLPPTMSQIFREYYQVGSMWDIHNTSVQQLADRANPYGTYIGRIQRTWVGSPLRVHRRCQYPMFDVANEVAYDGLMVQATSPKVSELAQLMRQHGWTDKGYWVKVRGQISGGTNHWIPEEGETVLKLLKHMYNLQQKLPNVYIITPFKNVSSSLKELLKYAREDWAERVPGKEIEAWVKDSVGTIHTFQGKQADGVILVLGCSVNHQDAIKWVTRSPNILNVALTRAKYFCFVVGNYNVWSEQPYFSTLAKHFVTITPEEGIPPGATVSKQTLV